MKLDKSLPTVDHARLSAALQADARAAAFAISDALEQLQTVRMTTKEYVPIASLLQSALTLLDQDQLIPPDTAPATQYSHLEDGMSLYHARYDNQAFQVMTEVVNRHYCCPEPRIEVINMVTDTAIQLSYWISDYVGVPDYYKGKIRDLALKIRHEDPELSEAIIAYLSIYHPERIVRGQIEAHQALASGSDTSDDCGCGDGSAAGEQAVR